MFWDYHPRLVAGYVPWSSAGGVCQEAVFGEEEIVGHNFFTENWGCLSYNSVGLSTAGPVPQIIQG